MREENVAKIRDFAGWLATAREEAGGYAAEMLALPLEAWDDWLKAHAAAASLPMLQALLDTAADGGARALLITEFVLRQVDGVGAPSDMDAVRRVLRGHAWRIRGDAEQLKLRSSSPRMIRVLPRHC